MARHSAERRRLLRIEPLEQRTLLSAIAVCDHIRYRPGPGGRLRGKPGVHFPSVNGIYAFPNPNGLWDQRDQPGRGGRHRQRPDHRHRRRLRRSRYRQRRGGVQHPVRLAAIQRLRRSDAHRAEPDRRRHAPDRRGQRRDGSVEESLDVEWAHAVAPQANIILFEANSASMSDLMAAVQTAAAYSGVSVVSMSWSGSEFSGETTYDSYFTTPAGHANVTFLASTGDSGSPGGYPAFSPNVVAVGGTTLTTLSSDIHVQRNRLERQRRRRERLRDRAELPKRSVQAPACGKRPTSPSTPIPTPAWPSTIPTISAAAPGMQVGGTSLACPCWAGLIAIADQFRAAEEVSLLTGPSALYALSEPLHERRYFNDITSGSNGNSAGTGYDMATGIGTPIANVLIPALAPTSAARLTVSMTDSGSGTFSTPATLATRSRSP